MKSLAGRTAIITGGNQGLGKAIAEAYVDAGANIIICARNEELLRQAGEELKARARSIAEARTGDGLGKIAGESRVGAKARVGTESGTGAEAGAGTGAEARVGKESGVGAERNNGVGAGAGTGGKSRTAVGTRAEAGKTQSVSYIIADISKEEDVERLVSVALEQHESIEILVNNAGVYGPKGLIEDVDWQEWTRAIEINLYGPILMTRALMKHFRKNSYGKIINLSGGGATAPLPRLSSYAASKAAIVRLTETFAHEVTGCGIDINAIAPGALNTRLLDEIIQAGPEAVGKQFYERSLKQRDDGGAPLEKAAELCVYLGSAESDGITGRLISAVWDPWAELQHYKDELAQSEIYTLRRIVPSDRGKTWG